MIRTVVAPIIAGVLLASVSLITLVSSQMAAPAKNPADQQIIVYGDR